MREIDQLIKDIPLDELLDGPAAEKETDIAAILPDTPKLVAEDTGRNTEQKNKNTDHIYIIGSENEHKPQIKARNRLMPVVAAALALAVGVGGILLLANRGAKKSSTESEAPAVTSVTPKADPVENKQYTSQNDTSDTATEEDRLAQAIYSAALAYSIHCNQESSKAASLTIPKGAEIFLDFDDPSAYADYIEKLQSYAEVKLTGKAMIKLSRDNSADTVVEVQKTEGGRIGTYPSIDEEVTELGQYPECWEKYLSEKDDGNILAIISDDTMEENYVDNFQYDPDRDIGLEEYDAEFVSKRNKDFETICSWYENFKTLDTEPVPLVSFREFSEDAVYIQFYLNGESVIIRSSDNDASSVYVNGYYYSVNAEEVLAAIKDINGIDELGIDNAEFLRMINELDFSDEICDGIPEYYCIDEYDGGTIEYYFNFTEDWAWRIINGTTEQADITELMAQLGDMFSSNTYLIKFTELLPYER